MINKGTSDQNTLGTLVVKYRLLIIIAYVLLLFPSVLFYLITGVNYDILAYMPDHLNSKQGEDLLEEEFGLQGTGVILVRGKEFWELRELKARIEAVEGVDSVLWLDDLADILMPVDFIEPRLKEQFVSGDSALLQIRFVENARTERTNRAVSEIELILDDRAVLGGEAAIISELQNIVEEEMIYYVLIAVLAIYVVLSLSVTSYIDPLVFLVSVGFAIAINMGTNIVFGEICFITASIAAVMQMGISLDYSIFLLHRFEEERPLHQSVNKAMAAAISKTSVAISSGALTTLGGFVALTVMENGIGQDLGFVLGKGIIVSLLVNLTLLPSLLLQCNRLSDRFRHRVLLPSFRPVAGWIIRGRIPFLVLFAVLAVLSFLAERNVDFYYEIKNYLPSSAGSVLATDEVMEHFGSANMVYLITSNEGRVTERELIDKIKRNPAVDSVTAISEYVDPFIPDSFIPAETAASFASAEYRYLMIYLSAFDDEGRAFEAVDMIRSYAGELHDQYYLTGSPALMRDMASLVDSDSRNVALVSTVCIALIIAVSFKSLLIPLLLLLVIQAAIWINLGIPYFQDQQLSSLTPVIIGAVQLGATVDYAILLALRYKENISQVAGRVEAMKKTIEDSGRSILTSALTMFSATTGMLVISSVRITGEITLLIGRGALISMVIIFLALPALLLLMEKPISHTTSGWTPAGNGKQTINRYGRR